jgi:pilus assembly protein CpaE
MARGIRAIVLNTEEGCAVELRSKLLSIDGLKIVAELDEPALFDTALKQFPAELVVINISSDPESMIQGGAVIHEKYPELTLFAVSDTDNPQLILQAIRNGFREYLIHPIEQEHLLEAVNRISRNNSVQKEQGKLICVLGSVGGIGSTLLATNLGCELAQMSKRSAVVVDLDIYFGQVATLLDITPQFSLADLCQTLDSMDPAMVEKALIKHDCGVSVLARPLHFNQAQQITAANVATILNSLCEMFDYVICDGPNRNDMVKPGFLDLADIAMFNMSLGVPSVRNVDRIVQELSREGYNLDRIHLVVSRYCNENISLTVDDVEESLSRKIFATIPEDSKTATTSINTGQPLIRSGQKTKLRESIKMIASKIHDPKAAEQEKVLTGAAGLISRVLGRQN